MTTGPALTVLEPTPAVEYKRHLGAWAARFNGGGPWVFDPELDRAVACAAKLARMSGASVPEELAVVPAVPRRRRRRPILSALRKLAPSLN